MTTEYLAFLRALNVGKRRISMPALAAVFEQAGATEVRTALASGNVRFCSEESDPARLEQHLEIHLRTALGYEVETFIRTRAEVRQCLANLPWDQATLEPGESLLVVFLKQPPDVERAARLAQHQSPVDELRLLGREIYWRARAGIHGSQLRWPTLTRDLGSPNTARNATALRKIELQTSRS